MVTSATVPPAHSRQTVAGRPLVVASDPRRGARPTAAHGRIVRR